MHAPALPWLLMVFLSVACNASPDPDPSSELRGLGGVQNIRIFTKNSDELVHFVRTISKVAQQIKEGAVSAREGLEHTLYGAILEVKGIPRHQVRAALSDMVSPQSIACDGNSCSRIFELETHEIDDFLDSLLKKTEVSKTLTSSSHVETKAILIASLTRGQDPAPKTRMYTYKGMKITEDVYVTPKPLLRGQRRIHIQRELSWTEQGVAIKKSYTGYVDYSVNGETIEIHVLNSNPEGVGTGRLVMKELAEEAQRLGKPEIQTLSTAVTAQEFYFKLGFRPAKDLLRRFAKEDPESYQDLIRQAQKRAGFASMPLSQRDDVITQTLGRVIGTWEGSTETIVKKTQRDPS